MQGHEVHFVCADDAHGAPIMLKAESRGHHAAGAGRAHRGDAPEAPRTASTSASTTGTRPTRRRTSSSRRTSTAGCKARGLIDTKTIEQFFDPVKAMFLPDRYIKGECPKCGAKDQYGDACENCSSVYAPTDLKNPYSTLSGATPVLKILGALLLPALRPALRRVPARVGARPGGCSRRSPTRRRNGWATTARRSATGTSRATRPTSASRSRTRRASTSTSGWTRRSATSRASRRTCAKKGHRLRRVPRRPDGRADPLHRQGHHLLPHAVLAGDAQVRRPLQGAGQRLRARLHHRLRREDVEVARHRHQPRRYLDLGMNPEWLRYYLAAKLNARVEDLDFNPDDFVARVNSDLVGKYVNIASRAAPFIDQALRRRARDAGRVVGRSARSRLATAQADGERRAMRTTTRASSARRSARSCASPTASTSTFDERSPGSSPRTRRNARAAVGLLAVPPALPLLTRLPEAGAAGLAAEVAALPRARRDFAWEDAARAPRHAVQPYKHLMLAHRPEADRRAARGRPKAPQRHPSAAGHGRGEAAPAEPAAAAGARGGRDHLHRRLRQDRPAHRAHRRRPSTSKARTSC